MGHPHYQNIETRTHASDKNEELKTRVQNAEFSFKHLLDSAMDSILVIAEDFRIHIANPSAEEMFLYRPNELLGKPLEILIPEPHRTKHQDYMRSFEQSHVTSRRMGRDAFVFGVRSNGEQFPIEIAISTYEVGSGKFYLAIMRDVTERQRLIVNLKNNEERYRFITEQTGHIIFDCNLLDGTMILNGAVKNITHYETEELGEINLQRWQTMIHPDDAVEIAELRETYSTRTDPFTIEYRLRRKDGIYRLVQEKGIYTKNALEQPVRISGVIQDITDDRQTQEYLYKLYQAIEQSPVSVLLTDIHGNIEYVNAKFSEVTGYSFAEAKGKNPNILKSGETRTEDYESLWKAILHGERWQGIFHNKKKNGSLYWQLSTITPIRDRKGEITNFMAVLEDIEERKQLEDALIESEKRFHRFFDNDIAGAFISTPDGTLIECNQAFVAMFGYASKEEALRTSTYNLYIRKEDRIDFLSKIRKHRHLTNHRGVFKKVSGEILYGSESSFGFFNGEGDLIELAGYIIDETRQKELEDQLIQSQKMESIGTLAAGVAHDFNNILSMILGSGEILLKRYPDKSEIVRYSDQIVQSANRGATIAQQLLLFSRSEPLDQKTISLKDSVLEIEKLLRHTLPKTITIRTEISNEPNTIIADSHQIQQIVINLAINASDAMPKGGLLHISVKEEDFDIVKGFAPDAVPQRYAVIRVSDNGMGIDDETVKRIFDPFFTTKPRTKGTGLGLSIVLGIVKSFSGYINVKSIVGKGTTFEIAFPLTKAVQSNETETIKKEEYPLHGSVLLVDDERSLMLIYEEILTFNGLKVWSAENALQGLELFLKHQDDIQVVISDLQMPIMGGEEFIEKLLRINPDLKILAISGYCSEDTKLKLQKLNIHNILQKPVSNKLLVQTIRELLKT